MKCSKCGEEIPEGSLYCERCGEDIHIVPDFEPELERSMQQNIDRILRDLPPKSERSRDSEGENSESGDCGERNSDSGEPDLDSGKDSGGRASGKKGWKVALALVCLLVLAAGVAAWGLYAYHSKEYQVSRGQRYAEAKKYEQAIACYSRALELDGKDIELTFRLAEMYFLKNNKIEYEYLLRDIARNPASTPEQLDRAYGRLIAIYRARGDYQTINDLLLASGNEALQSTYQNYVAKKPEFSIKEGYYNSIQPLKLTAFGAGKIYYTMDGSEPTVESTPYTAPIILENGDYIIKAYFVNDNGIVSDVASKEYHIEIDEIPEPQVSALSGEYNRPMNIEVTGDVGDIYYTTDGTVPTYSSNAYTAPIPMPLGKSTFRFAQIVNGVTGNVLDRSYQLELNTEYTPLQAVADIVEYSMTSGKIYDEAGHFDDTQAVYQYEFQYVTNVNDAGDFYVVAEILRSSDGSLAKTGTNYAVNAYTGEYFRLEQDKRGNYNLIILEKVTVADSEEEDEEEE